MQDNFFKNQNNYTKRFEENLLKIVIAVIEFYMLVHDIVKNIKMHT